MRWTDSLKYKRYFSENFFGIESQKLTPGSLAILPNGFPEEYESAPPSRPCQHRALQLYFFFAS